MPDPLQETTGLIATLTGAVLIGFAGVIAVTLFAGSSI
jgi:hypothetical protein